MDWINEHWSVSEAAKAKEWMLEAVQFGVIFIYFPSLRQSTDSR
jgi:hypothetical protein